MNNFFNPVEERYSADEIAAVQQKRLCAMVRHTDQNNAYFHRRYQEAGVDSAGFRGLEIPPAVYEQNRLPRTIPRRYVLRAENTIAEMHMSSGSTGTPVVMLYTLNDVNQWAECMARCYCMAGAKPGDVVQITPAWFVQRRLWMLHGAATRHVHRPHSRQHPAPNHPPRT